MKKAEKVFYIKKINTILKSKSSKLSKADTEQLIVIREKIANSRNKLGIAKALIDFLKLFGLTEFFDQ